MQLDALLILAPSPNPGMLYSYKFQGMPPLGLGYIGTYLQQNGFSVKILDLGRPQITVLDVINILNEKRVGIVGISCTTETYNSALRISRIIKEKEADLPIVLGGPHVTFEYQKALEEECIDYIVRFEGEKPFLNLCTILLRGEGNLDKVGSICYRSGKQVIVNPPEPFISDLDTLPFPDRTIFDDLNSYAHPSTCSASRGCPGECIFCAASALSGRKYRMRTAKSIVDEFEYLKSLGYEHVDIVDDTMTASLHRLRAFLRELNERNLGMSWYCESRVDVMTKELLEEMKAAGCTILQFGVEAGSQEMLDKLKKNIALSKVYQVYTWCKEIGIEVSTNLIVGQPFDTPESIHETFLVAKDLLQLSANVSFTVCTPFPGTYIWNHPDELGIHIVEENLDKYSTFYPVYDSSHMNVREIRNAYYSVVKEANKLKPNSSNPTLKKLIRRLESSNGNDYSKIFDY